MEAEKGKTATPTTWKEKDNVSQMFGLYDYEQVMPFTELGNIRHWAAFEGEFDEFHFGYTEFEMALNLGGEVEWAVIYMTLLPWRQIWTVEDQIGVYHHIDGDWNFGSGCDWPGRECTAEKKLLIASRSLGANNSIEAASCSSCLLFKCWEHRRLRCLGTSENTKKCKVGKQSISRKKVS